MEEEARPNRELVWMVHQLVLAWGQYRRDLKTENERRREEHQEAVKKADEEYARHKAELEHRQAEAIRRWGVELSEYYRQSWWYRRTHKAPERPFTVGWGDLHYPPITPLAPVIPTWVGFMDWLAEHHSIWSS